MPRKKQPQIELAQGLYIPILKDNDHAGFPIGRAYSDHGQLVIEFFVGVTDQQFRKAFGDAGATIIETERKGKVKLIRKARIFEFSITSEDRLRIF